MPGDFPSPHDELPSSFPDYSSSRDSEIIDGKWNCLSLFDRLHFLYRSKRNMAASNVKKQLKMMNI